MNQGTLNRATLIGRIGREPQLHYTAGGKAVAHFSMATLQRYKDKDGRMKFKPEWHRVVIWNTLAVRCGGFLQKGTLVYVEGLIKTRSTGKEGKRLTEIVVTRINRILSRSAQTSQVMKTEENAA